MQIAEKAWSEYVKKMAEVNEKAAAIMKKYIETNGTEDVRELLQYAEALIRKYGSASGELACRMYEKMAESQGAAIAAAEMAEIPEYAEIAKAVNGAAKQSEKIIPSTIGRMVKQVGADTMIRNAARDGAEFAWIPHGDSCPFCITLASRGWERISKKAARNGRAQHIHGNCDCEYAVRFDGKSGVRGYNPEIYKKMYYNANGDLNQMRREHYARNAERIRAQKRRAYAERMKEDS